MWGPVACQAPARLASALSEVRATLVAATSRLCRVASVSGDPGVRIDDRGPRPLTTITVGVAMFYYYTSTAMAARSSETTTCPLFH